MKVLITGSRDWPHAHRGLIREALVESGATIVIHGDAQGADRIAKWEALGLGLVVKPYPADWDTFGNRAGSIRNQQMLDEEHRPEEPIDLVLAFPLPQSIGTYDMMKRVRGVGIPVKEFSLP